MDKFAGYYLNNPERILELSEYVHQNFKLIETKMISEMRRKLDIEPNLNNKDGYVSLMMSLHGRMFNEVVYGLCGMLQSQGMNIMEVIPPNTLLILFDLIQGKNYLQGDIRTDVENNIEKFKKYYLENIDELRKSVQALPKG